MQRNHVLGLVAAAVGALVVALVVVLAADDDPAGEPPEEVAAASSTTTSSTTSTTAASSSSAGSSSTSTPAAAGQVLRFDSYDRYRIGMTGRESGLRVDANSGPDPESCGFAKIGNGVSAMIAADRLVRFDVSEGSQVRSEAGVGIGATEDEVKRAYGNRVRVEGHAYDELGNYLIVQDPARQNLLLLFETDGTRVTTFRSGERNAVEAPEGCA